MGFGGFVCCWRRVDHARGLLGVSPNNPPLRYGSPPLGGICVVLGPSPESNIIISTLRFLRVSVYNPLPSRLRLPPFPGPGTPMLSRAQRWGLKKPCIPRLRLPPVAWAPAHRCHLGPNSGVCKKLPSHPLHFSPQLQCHTLVAGSDTAVDGLPV